MRTPKQYLRDMFRRKAPPPDEKPVGFFPQVFITPRALRDLAAFEEKRKQPTCVLLTRVGIKREIEALATIYGNLRHNEVVRVTCPEVPAYLAKDIVEANAGYLIDFVPALNDPIGTRSPNHPWCVQLPWPGGATASDPGMLRISMERLEYMHPQLMHDAAAIEVVEQIASSAYHMLFSDASPAIVVVTQPNLVVSVFSSDIDCVVLLRFEPSLSEFLVDALELKSGRKLIALSSYRDDPEVVSDLTPGPKYKNWTNYHPYIAEFMAEDSAQIEQLHTQMPEWSWQRCRELTAQKLKAGRLTYRDGRPLFSAKPART